jgi:GntR family transcriptional repressor for pyruvate dehydrogenase complex
VAGTAGFSVTPVERLPASPPAIAVAREMIRWLTESNEIEVGQKLPSERELVEMFQVGRSAVREALKSISLLGLVEIRQGAGTYLTNRSSQLLPQVLEWGLILGEENAKAMIDARVEVEVVLARMAAARRTPDDVQGLEGAYARMSEAADADDLEAWVSNDIAFHMAVADAAHNAVLADFLARLRDLLRAWMQRASSLDRDFAPKLAAHKAILDAIAAGKEKDAGKAMRAHMNAAFARLEFPESNAA